MSRCIFFVFRYRFSCHDDDDDESLIDVDYDYDDAVVVDRRCYYYLVPNFVVDFDTVIVVLGELDTCLILLDQQLQLDFRRYFFCYCHHIDLI
jgi:hypothetical protein